MSNQTISNEETKCGHCDCMFNLDVALKKKTGLDTTNSDCCEYSYWYFNEKDDGDDDRCYSCFYFDEKCSCCKLSYNTHIEFEKEGKYIESNYEEVDYEDFEYEPWYFYFKNEERYSKLKRYECLCYDCFTTQK